MKENNFSNINEKELAEVNGGVDPLTIAGVVWFTALAGVTIANEVNRASNNK